MENPRMQRLMGACYWLTIFLSMVIATALIIARAKHPPPDHEATTCPTEPSSSALS